MAPIHNGSVKERRKKKRVSKKNKIAWRKHCDSKAVDSFLEEVRHEERVGVKFDTAEDCSLFFVDTEPAVPGTGKIETKAERKLLAKKKLEGGPDCFKILEARSSVPDPVKKRNKIRTPEERRDPLVKKIEAKRKACGVVKEKEKEKIRNRELYEETKLNSFQPDAFDKDLWSEDTKNVDLEWLNPTTLRHTLKHTRQIKKKVPLTVIKKTSVLPAIEEPHPGTSYNPTFADHRSLLEDIVSKEKELIKEEQHIIRVTDHMFSKVPRSHLEKSFVKEMGEGLPNLEDFHRKEDDNQTEYKADNPPVLDKKKTRKARRNMKLAKEEEQSRKLKAIEKKKVADIYKLKKIMENLNKADVKAVKRQEMLKRRQANKELQPKQLSKVKFAEHETEFNMPYDLSGSLRKLKTEGNLLFDRFKSMQKRNILEPLAFQRVRNRGKKKVYTRNTHK